MDDNSTYNSKDLLKKHLNNLLSTSEKEAFEKQVVEDEFEKEAFEGFESLGDNALASQMIQNVEKKIADKTNLKQTKEFTIPYVRIVSIAASVLVLFGIGFFVTQALKTNQTTVAKNEIHVTEQTDNSTIVPNNIFSDSLNQVADSVVPSSTEILANLNPQENEGLIKKEEKDKTNEIESAPPKKLIKPVETSDLMLDDEVSYNDISRSTEDLQKTNAMPAADNAYNNAVQAVAEERVESSASKTNGANPLSHFQVGKTAYDAKNYNQAINYFEQAISNGKNVIESEYYVGMSYFNLNKQGKAIKNFDTVINSASPLKYNAMWFKSLILLDKGDESGAKAILQNLANGNSGFKNQAQDKLNSLK